MNERTVSSDTLIGQATTDKRFAPKFGAVPESAAQPPPQAPATTLPRPEQIPPPADRDPLWFSPLFVLAPARSNSTVAATMIGMHPELYGFPELALFRRDTVAQLMVDPPGWRGAPAKLRVSGMLRSIAQLHDGEQTDRTVADALVWLQGRRTWRVEMVLDHLLGCVAPRIGVEKSPETSSRDNYLARATAAYPRARFLHLTRHPLSTVESMHRSWHQLGYWEIEPETFHNFCLGVWFFQHQRIHRLLEALPPDRGMQVRSEDMLNTPQDVLPRICKWLGVDVGQEAIDAMCHPERSTHAGLGPSGAVGGGDSGFLRDPVMHTTPLPDSLDLPPEWLVDPWLLVAAMDLAHQLGYGPEPDRGTTLKV